LPSFSPGGCETVPERGRPEQSSVSARRRHWLTPHDVGVEVFQQAFAQLIEKLLTRIDGHQLERQSVQAGHELLVVGGNLHQAVQLAVEVLVAGPQLLDLPLDQRRRFAALMVQVEGFEYLRMLFEEVRVFSQVGRDNVLGCFLVVTHSSSL
jgi:hypothetical protein